MRWLFVFCMIVSAYGCGAQKGKKPSSGFGFKIDTTSRVPLFDADYFIYGGRPGNYISFDSTGDHFVIHGDTVMIAKFLVYELLKLQSQVTKMTNEWKPDIQSKFILHKKRVK